MTGLSENKELMEDSARNLRCSGVSGARVVQVVAYKIVVDDDCQRLQRYASGKCDAAPVPMYERGDLP